MNTYLLSERAQRWTFKKWKKAGGCGLSDYAHDCVAHALGKEWTARTLAEIQQASLVAGREMARFGRDHLKLRDFAVVEYENI